MKYFKSKKLHSQSGQAMLLAIQTALAVAVVVGILLDQSHSTDGLLKRPRIRSAMMGAYQRLRILSVTPSTFVCPPGAGNGNNPTNCQIAPIPNSELNQYFPQAPCPANHNPCGVEIKNLVLQNGHLKGTIEYTGTDFAFNPTDVDIAVPPEILQASQNDCFSMDPTRPVFAGFLSDGTPDCRPLQGQCSGLGEYVLSVDPKTLKVTCGNFQSNVGCPPNQYMTSLKWSGKAFSTTCADRQDPFTKFAYTASTTLGSAAITDAPAPSNPLNTCQTTTTTTTTLPVVVGGMPTGDTSCTYVTTFDEEFDTGYDTAKWNDKIWYGPQCPTQNYTVENGLLKIWPVMEANGTFCDRTIDTDGKFSQEYGFYEMEAKLPYGKGAWPAFWLLNRAGSNRDEIDIMEAYSGGGTATGWSDSSLHPTMYGITIHDGDTSSDTIVGFLKQPTADLSAGLHKYGLKWEASKMTFYFDGNIAYTLNISMGGPMYVLLDLWFGSASGTPDGTTPQGKTNAYEVNYVRVWKCQ